MKRNTAVRVPNIADDRSKNVNPTTRRWVERLRDSRGQSYDDGFMRFTGPAIPSYRGGVNTLYRAAKRKGSMSREPLSPLSRDIESSRARQTAMPSESLSIPLSDTRGRPENGYMMGGRPPSERGTSISRRTEGERYHRGLSIGSRPERCPSRPRQMSKEPVYRPITLQSIRDSKGGKHSSAKQLYDICDFRPGKENDKGAGRDELEINDVQDRFMAPTRSRGMQTEDVEELYKDMTIKLLELNQKQRNVIRELENKMRQCQCVKEQDNKSDKLKSQYKTEPQLKDSDKNERTTSTRLPDQTYTDNLIPSPGEVAGPHDIIRPPHCIEQELNMFHKSLGTNVRPLSRNSQRSNVDLYPDMKTINSGSKQSNRNKNHEGYMGRDNDRDGERTRLSKQNYSNSLGEGGGGDMKDSNFAKLNKQNVKNVISRNTRGYDLGSGVGENKRNYFNIRDDVGVRTNEQRCQTTNRSRRSKNIDASCLSESDSAENMPRLPPPQVPFLELGKCVSEDGWFSGEQTNGETYSHSFDVNSINRRVM